jgi:hypothetical protein
LNAPDNNREANLLGIMVAKEYGSLCKKTTESVCKQKAKLALQNLVQTKLQWWSTEEETNRRKTFVSTIIQGLKKHSSYKKKHTQKGGRRKKKEKKRIKAP